MRPVAIDSQRCPDISRLTLCYNCCMIAPDRPLAELVEALPPDIQASVRDFVEFLLRKREQAAEPVVDTGENGSQFPVDPRRPAMLREVEAYYRLHPELRQKYRDQYVAIFQGKLVDHDSDPEALLERVLDQFPDQVVLQRKVEESPEVVLRFRSPRFEQPPRVQR